MKEKSNFLILMYYRLLNKVNVSLDDPQFSQITTHSKCLQQGIIRALQFKLDSFAAKIISEQRKLLKDQKFMNEVKLLAKKKNCLEFFRAIYKKYGEARQ